MPQASPIIPLLRKAYPQSFATQPDASVRDYFYRLMFEPVSFGDARQGQTFRRQVLSDMKQLAQQAMPGVAPPSNKEFVIWARKQALGMAPERPMEIKERQAFSRKAFDYEQKFGDLAHPILFTEEFAKNLFGKPAASLVSLASIIPGAPREATQAVADAISPRIEFGQHVTEKYGQLAGLGYTFGEALAGFGPVVSAAKLGAGLAAATRIPGIAGAARTIATNETLFSTLFFGSYSAGEYNRAMLEQGKEPTAGGFATNLGAGMALGYFFPKAKKVFASAKESRPWVNNVLAPMLEKKVADVKVMNPAQLRQLLIDRGYKSRKDIAHAVQSVRFVRSYKGSIAKDLLKQSTKAGVLGAATGGVSQASQGMPIDVPSLIQNAVFMQGFHAHGIAGAFGKPIGKAKPGKVEDGMLKLGVEGDRRKLIDAFKPFFEEPDIAPERGIAEFSKILRETYGVEKIEVEKGEFRNLSDFFELVDPRNLPEKTKAVIGRIGKARAEKDFLLASKEEAQLDSYFAQIARAKGGSPTEVPFGEAEAVDVPTAKKAQTMYMWLHELIGNNVGREAQDAFRRGLGTDMPLSQRAATEPRIARILEQFPAAEAVERLFDATVRGLDVSPELWQAAKEFRVPRGLLKAGLERLVPEEMPPGLEGLHITPKSIKDLRDVGLIRKGAKIIEKDGIVVAEKGRQEAFEGGKIVPGEMFYDVFQIGKSTGNVEIKKGITTGSTISEATVRKFGFPIPGEKVVKPPVKPIQPAWEPKASAGQREAINALRKRIKRPDQWRVLANAFKAAKEEFKGARGKMRPDEIAEAERLLKIQREKRAQLRAKLPKEKTEPEELIERIGEIDKALSAGKAETAKKLYDDLYKLLTREPVDSRTKEAKEALSRLEEVNQRIKDELKRADVAKVISQARKKMKGLPQDESVKVYEAAKRVNPTKLTSEQLRSEETIQGLLDTEKVLVNYGFLEKETHLAKYPGLTFEEKSSAAKRIWQASGKAIWASTREKGDVVTFGDRVGKILNYDAKAGEYTIVDFLGTPDSRTKRVLWSKVDRTIDQDVIDKNISYLTRALKKGDIKGADITEALDNATKKQNLGIIYGGIPIDPGAIARLFRGRKNRKAVTDAIKENPGLADRIGEVGRMLHTFRSTRDPLLTYLAKTLFYGEPQKLVTPRQWNWINKAVEFNRTNPYMNDGRGGTINAADFVQAVLGRRNYHPEIAKESGQPFEPMTREDARDVLKAYARISEAIRDRNWPLALKVFLPVAMKKYSPRIEREWDGMFMYENEMNGVRAEGDRLVRNWNAKIGKGNEANPATQTERFQAYNEKHYGYIWEMSRKHGWMPEGKENRWKNGRTLAQEFHGLVTGIIPWNEPFLNPRVVEIAREYANPLKQRGRYAMSFRDRMWHFMNDGLRRYEYPGVRGRMYADTDYFRDVYTHWKMQSEKTTPENSEAMKTKFQKEADKILANEKRKEETINAIMEGKKLGKIVDAKGKSIYYPFFDPKMAEKMLESEAAIEEGRLPSGGLGKLMHAQHRKATVEYHIATGEFDPVRDINAYTENVTSYLWRSAVRYHTWRGTKNIRRDIIENPQYAQIFQRHIEIMEKLRGDLLDRQDGALHRLSQNVGLMASAIMLAHPKTVFRNIMGGHALTIIHNGFKDFAEASKFLKSPAGRRIVDRAGHEAGALFSEAESMIVDPKRFRAMLTRGASTATEHQIDRVVRLMSSYALSRPFPFVTDLIPGLQDVVKGLSFSGSEVSLRDRAYASGFLSAVRRIMEAPKKQNKIRTIYGNSAKELLSKVERQYAEIEITPDDISGGIKKNPAKFKGAKRFMLKIVGPETNAEQRARAYRAGIQGGATSVMMTQFIYSNLNRPSVMGHPLGRVVLLFRKYTWNRFNFASTIIKEAMPQRGGGQEEFARLMRFAIALSAAKALGAVIGFNLYRFVEDDVVSMLASINDWFSQDPDKRKQATFGKPAWQFLTGAEFSRNIDVLINSDMPTWEKALTVSHLPYSRAAVDVYREHLKVSEGRKNVYEALMNFHFGLYRYNYGGKGRRKRRSR